MNDTEYEPKHRADRQPRTQPRVQPTGKHIGEYVPEDRTHERLGAEAFDLRGLMRATFVGNPFRGSRV